MLWICTGVGFRVDLRVKHLVGGLIEWDLCGVFGFGVPTGLTIAFGCIDMGCLVVAGLWIYGLGFLL